jgi:hypothetical protein
VKYADAKCGCCGFAMRDCLCDESCEAIGPRVVCKCGGERLVAVTGDGMYRCEDCKRIDHEDNLYQ